MPCCRRSHSWLGKQVLKLQELYATLGGRWHVPWRTSVITFFYIGEEHVGLKNAVKEFQCLNVRQSIILNVFLLLLEALEFVLLVAALRKFSSPQFIIAAKYMFYHLFSWLDWKTLSMRIVCLSFVLGQT